VKKKGKEEKMWGIVGVVVVVADSEENENK
jgi:hypothetical protein